jgi:Fic family protein
MPMMLLPTDSIDADRDLLGELDRVVTSIYRLITFSRHHLADDLLDRFLASTNELQQLLGIKNAQMEAQTETEAATYLTNVNRGLERVVDEIRHHIDFVTQQQLFELFRIISPEGHRQHPNTYRQSLVQVGRYLCPEPAAVPGAVAALFHTLPRIPDPVLRAVYFHHELIRIHPFADGNGRTARIAKNWMLMYRLYPPIFIRDEQEKIEYITTLERSFLALDRNPGVWNEHTAAFFEQEIRRILYNSRYLMAELEAIGEIRASEA